MNKPPAILQIIPSLTMGGAERGCIDVAKAIEAMGWQSLIASEGGPMLGELAGTNVRHITMPLASKNPLTMAQNAQQLKELIQKRGIHLVHARSRAPAWSAEWAAREAGVPFMTTAHAAYKFSNPLKKFYNAIMGRGVRVIAISRFIAAHMAASYGVPSERLRTIFCGIDLSHFDPKKINAAEVSAQRLAWQAAEDVPILLLPGRITRIKGHAVALSALALLKQESQAKLVILGHAQGRDAYVQELHQEIERLELTQRVIFAQTKNMPLAYAAADLVLSPSIVPEGFGRVPVEAQAMGRPVIASAIGATAETIEQGRNAWLVPPENPAALAASIKMALQIPEAESMLQRQRALQAMHNEFSLSAMLARTLSVYAELLPEKL